MHLQVKLYELYVTNFHYLGSIMGVIYIYKVYNLKWELINQIYDSNSQITNINVSNELNICVVATKDHNVYLYTFPEMKLYRVIKHQEIKSCDKVPSS